MEQVDLYIPVSWHYNAPSCSDGVLAVAPDEEKPKDDSNPRYKYVGTIDSDDVFYVLYYQYIEAVYFDRDEAIEKAKINTEGRYQDYKDDDPDATDEDIRNDPTCHATIYKAHLKETTPIESTAWKKVGFNRYIDVPVIEEQDKYEVVLEEDIKIFNGEEE